MVVGDEIGAAPVALEHRCSAQRRRSCRSDRRKQSPRAMRCRLAARLAHWSREPCPGAGSAASLFPAVRHRVAAPAPNAGLRRCRSVNLPAHPHRQWTNGPAGQCAAREQPRRWSAPFRDVLDSAAHQIADVPGDAVGSFAGCSSSRWTTSRSSMVASDDSSASVMRAS